MKGDKNDQYFNELDLSDIDSAVSSDINHLLRVNCLFLSSGISPTKNRFYICSCNPSPKHLICEECIRYCHLGSDHTQVNSVVVSGICNCGVNMHHVKSSNSMSNSNQSIDCVFNEINAISGTNDIYLFKSKGTGEVVTSLCLFCANFCYEDPNLKQTNHENFKHTGDSMFKLNLGSNQKYQKLIEKNKIIKNSNNRPQDGLPDPKDDVPFESENLSDMNKPSVQPNKDLNLDGPAEVIENIIVEEKNSKHKCKCIHENHVNILHIIELLIKQVGENIILNNLFRYNNHKCMPSFKSKSPLPFSSIRYLNLLCMSDSLKAQIFKDFANQITLICDQPTDIKFASEFGYQMNLKNFVTIIKLFKVYLHDSKCVSILDPSISSSIFKLKFFQKFFDSNFEISLSTVEIKLNILQIYKALYIDAAIAPVNCLSIADIENYPILFYHYMLSSNPIISLLKIQWKSHDTEKWLNLVIDQTSNSNFKYYEEFETLTTAVKGLLVMVKFNSVNSIETIVNSLIKVINRIIMLLHLSKNPNSQTASNHVNFSFTPKTRNEFMNFLLNVLEMIYFMIYHINDTFALNFIFNKHNENKGIKNHNHHHEYTLFSNKSNIGMSISKLYLLCLKGIEMEYDFFKSTNFMKGPINPHLTYTISHIQKYDSLPIQMFSILQKLSALVFLKNDSYILRIEQSIPFSKLDTPGNLFRVRMTEFFNGQRDSSNIFIKEEINIRKAYLNYYLAKTSVQFLVEKIKESLSSIISISNVNLLKLKDLYTFGIKDFKYSHTDSHTETKLHMLSSNYVWCLLKVFQITIINEHEVSKKYINNEFIEIFFSVLYFLIADCPEMCILFMSESIINSLMMLGLKLSYSVIVIRFFANCFDIVSSFNFHIKNFSSISSMLFDFEESVHHQYNISKELDTSKSQAKNEANDSNVQIIELSVLFEFLQIQNKYFKVKANKELTSDIELERARYIVISLISENASIKNARKYLFELTKSVNAPENERGDSDIYQSKENSINSLSILSTPRVQTNQDLQKLNEPASNFIFKDNECFSPNIKMLLQNAFNPAEAHINKEINHLKIKIMIELLELINYLFDGSSIDTECRQLETFLTAEMVMNILKCNSFDLTLRKEILKYYRMMFIDAFVDETKIGEYRKAFVESLKLNNVNENSPSQEMHEKLGQINFNTSIDEISYLILMNEITNFSNIIYSGSNLHQDWHDYFENGIIVPVKVYLNINLNLIDTFSGYNILDLCQLVYKFLKMSLFVLQENLINPKIFEANEKGKDAEKNTIESDINKEEHHEVHAHAGGIFKKSRTSLNSELHFSRLLKIRALEEIINQMTTENFKPYDTKFLLKTCQDHIFSMILFNSQTSTLLDYLNESIEHDSEKSINTSNEIIKKLDDEIDSLENEIKNSKGVKSSKSIYKNESDPKDFTWQYHRKLLKKFKIVYIQSKLQFHNSSITNVLPCNYQTLNVTFRNVLLKHLFTVQISKSNLEHYEIILINLINETSTSQREIHHFYQIEMLNNLADTKFKGILSIIFSQSNPTSLSIIKEYLVTCYSIKIFKFLCEGHNQNFQNLIFRQIELSLGRNVKFNLFGFLLLLVEKIIWLSEWNDPNDNKLENHYYFPLFKCLIDLIIECIQGSQLDNFKCIVPKKTSNSEDKVGQTNTLTNAPTGGEDNTFLFRQFSNRNSMLKNRLSLKDCFTTIKSNAKCLIPPEHLPPERAPEVKKVIKKKIDAEYVKNEYNEIANLLKSTKFNDGPIDFKQMASKIQTKEENDKSPSNVIRSDAKRHTSSTIRLDKNRVEKAKHKYSIVFNKTKTRSIEEARNQVKYLPEGNKIRLIEAPLKNFTGSLNNRELRSPTQVSKYSRMSPRSTDKKLNTGNSELQDHKKSSLCIVSRRSIKNPINYNNYVANSSFEYDLNYFFQTFLTALKSILFTMEVDSEIINQVKFLLYNIIIAFLEEKNCVLDVKVSIVKYLDIEKLLKISRNYLKKVFFKKYGHQLIFKSNIKNMTPEMQESIRTVQRLGSSANPAESVVFNAQVLDYFTTNYEEVYEDADLNLSITIFKIFSIINSQLQTEETNLIQNKIKQLKQSNSSSIENFNKLFCVGNYSHLFSNDTKSSPGSSANFSINQTLEKRLTKSLNALKMAPTNIKETPNKKILRSPGKRNLSIYSNTPALNHEPIEEESEERLELAANNQEKRAELASQLSKTMTFKHKQSKEMGILKQYTEEEIDTLENCFQFEFFNNILRRIRVVYNNEDVEVIFIKAPSVKYFSNNLIKFFYKNVDISSRTNKLIYLQNETEFFKEGIEYLEYISKKSELLNFLANWDYRPIYWFIFLLAVTLNVVIIFWGELDPALRADWYNEIIYWVGGTMILLSTAFIILNLTLKVPFLYNFQLQKYQQGISTSKTSAPSFVSKCYVYFIDCIYKNDDMYFLLINLIFCLLGVSSHNLDLFFSFTLIGIYNFSEELYTIVNSLTSKKSMLLQVLFLMFLIMFIYGFLGMTALFETFNGQCDTLFSCFSYMVNLNLKSRFGISFFMKNISYFEDAPLYIGKSFYQLSLFWIVIVIMHNIFIAIIVDSFKRLRIDKEKRHEELTSNCFICNATKDQLEQQGVSFLDHITEIHNVEEYIHYMIYLRMQNIQDLNAVNSAIKLKLEQNNTSWIPFNKPKKERDEEQKLMIDRTENGKLLKEIKENYELDIHKINEIEEEELF